MRQDPPGGQRKDGWRSLGSYTERRGATGPTKGEGKAATERQQNTRKGARNSQSTRPQERRRATKRRRQPQQRRTRQSRRGRERHPPRPATAQRAVAKGAGDGEDRTKRLPAGRGLRARRERQDARKQATQKIRTKRGEEGEKPCLEAQSNNSTSQRTCVAPENTKSRAATK